MAKVPMGLLCLMLVGMEQEREKGNRLCAINNTKCITATSEQEWACETRQ